MSQHHLLVAGASGVIGRAATMAFEEAGWRVTTLSRSSEGPGSGHHVSADLLDVASLRDASDVLSSVTHVFYAALKPDPDPATEAQQNGDMMRHLFQVLEESQASIEHLVFVQGGKVYGAHLGVYKTPAREEDSRHFPPNLYFEHEDLARELERKGIRWTALRPDIVIGHSLGSAMNLGNLIGLYGTLCRELGVAMQFPGTARAYDILLNICDADLVGKAALWAIAENQQGPYNVTNGDQIRWRHVWPEIANWFGLETGEPQPISLETRLAAVSGTWKTLAERQGLAETDIDKIAQGGFGDFIFHVEKDAVFDLTKARQAGFAEMCRRSPQSLIQHLEAMREHRLIP
ncbi:SDR family oxidoreductase [Cobetia sp. 10Alg 146]|uniref:SDR family oxidoreductase n=1 Tax=Cobetia sp. 10Alg 146 TaxID=3040019 RepID=UPI0024479CEB|nr:SDR family oxidoreductase [Cobetia sp. 10Alg 146]MDH2291558.1 SDR family oxidoreductase [Cobetia sp. 10Alg 146]